MKKKIKSSDWIAMRLKQECEVCFGITGGAVVNLMDSIHKYGPVLVNMHHEQACAMAADAYARVTGELAVTITTSGPGITNAITGSCCSHFDSIPSLVIAGQVPTNQLKEDLKVRQKGFQEVDSLKLYQPISKCCVRPTKNSVGFDFNFAIDYAKYDRKGTSLVELCDDVQREMMVEEPSKRIKKEINLIPKNKINKVFKLIKKSKKPIIVAGSGCREISSAFMTFCHFLEIPVLLTWGAMDLLPDDHPLNIRDFGVTSQRIGNFALEASDLIICLGTRLDTHEFVNWDKLKAKKIIVDIDGNELRKQKADLFFENNISDFAINLVGARGISLLDQRGRVYEWIARLKKLREKYPIVLPKYYKEKNYVNPYVFINSLSDYVNKGDVIITDAGQTLVWTMQAWKVKFRQRLFSAFNNSPMGYAVPASIGAYFGSPPLSKIIAITGDGGLMMNLQELQTISNFGLAIKLFVLYNQGYGMIRQTQSDWEGLQDKVSTEVGFPNYRKLAKCFGLRFTEIKTHKDLSKIKGVLKSNKPSLCVVRINPESRIEPKLKSGDDFVNQKPYLPKSEINKIRRLLK